MTKKKTAPEPSRLLLSPNQAAALAVDATRRAAHKDGGQSHV
jgi:hypothetical protein